jgi:hypothetical protein
MNKKKRMNQEGSKGIDRDTKALAACVLVALLAAVVSALSGEIPDPPTSWQEAENRARSFGVSQGIAEEGAPCECMLTFTQYEGTPPHVAFFICGLGDAEIYCPSVGPCRQTWTTRDEVAR